MLQLGRLLDLRIHWHCLKSVRIRSFSDLYFPVFGLNTEIYCVNPYIQSKSGIIRTRKTSAFGHFSRRLKAFDNFKSKQKIGWSSIFWYVKVYIFRKCIQYTIHWDKTQMLRMFPLDKTNSTKNTLFFLSEASIHHSFTFNLGLLYEMKLKVRLSKTVCGIFHWSCYKIASRIGGWAGLSVFCDFRFSIEVSYAAL